MPPLNASARLTHLALFLEELAVTEIHEALAEKCRFSGAPTVGSGRAPQALAASSDAGAPSKKALRKANDVAEDWYLALKGKAQAGELKRVRLSDRLQLGLSTSSRLSLKGSVVRDMSRTTNSESRIISSRFLERRCFRRLRRA